jgi:ribosomal protein S18 acetylase RimI-like enzyme
MSVEIRRVGPDDAALFGRVAEDVFDNPIDAAQLAAYLAAGGHLMVVALQDRSVVGQGRAIVHLQPDEPNQLYIDNLGVTPALFRQGIGRRIMDELFAWGRELGCKGAWVATESDNVPAIGLYEALGAEPVEMVYFEYEDWA